jgi:hypothetical protein
MFATCPTQQISQTHGKMQNKAELLAGTNPPFSSLLSRSLSDATN